MLNSYDNLSRPTRMWARDQSGEDVTLRQHLIYGDNAGLTDPQNNNLKGKLYRHYDEAGLTKINSYDFKGNVLEKKRQVISDAEILSVFDGFTTTWNVESYRVDWDTFTTSPDEKLDEKEYITGMEYDALNRVTKMIYPKDTDNQRKILLPEYNRSGTLEKVSMKDTEVSTPQIYVERIAYNAKGQRILLALGNGIMTRYRYNSTTFRLERVKTEKYDNSSNPLVYVPNGGNQLNMSYEYDLAGNIIKTIDETTGAGIPNTPDGLNKLTRQFSYDALYRLLSANGRETDQRGTKPWEDTYRSSDPNVARSYSESYSYDKLGNIQSLQHTSTNGFTRTFAYTANTNKLSSIAIGSDTYTFQHDVNGNITSDDGGNSRHYEYNYGDKISVFKRQVGTSEPSTYAHYLYDAGKKAGRRFS